MATSPRRALSPEEKVQQEAAFRVDAKRFGEVLDGVIQIYEVLNSLTIALSVAGKGAYLAYPHPSSPGEHLVFNRRHLKSANSKFKKAIKSLKVYFRVSMKKPRDKTPPESFKGIYTPVFAGAALQEFFNSAPGNFGFASPAAQSGTALMDLLPNARQGYLLRNTSTLLFYIYAHAQQLQDPQNGQYVRSDDVMTRAFGGNIPATFHPAAVDGKAGKVSMAVAIANGLAPPEGKNTYQIVTESNAGKAAKDIFDPARFKNYYFQNLAALNYYSKTSLAADPTRAAEVENMRDPQMLAAMLQEHNAAKQASLEWKQILEPGRKVARDARKKVLDAQKKADKAAAAAGQGQLVQ